MSQSKSSSKEFNFSDPQSNTKALQRKVFELQKDLSLKEIEIERLDSSNTQSFKKIKICEDLLKLKDQTIKKLKNTVKQKEAIIIDKDEQIQEMNELNPYWTDPIKASQLVQKIMERSQNPALSINEEDRGKIEKNINKIKEAFSLLYDLLKQEAQNIPQAQQFAGKNPVFFIEQPLKLIQLYKLVVRQLKKPIPQNDKQVSQVQKRKMLEKQILIYEKFAEDLKNALRYTSFYMAPDSNGSGQEIEHKGLVIMKQNLNKLFNVRYKEQKKFQQKGISNYETQLKEHLLNYIETIKGSVTTCIFNIQDAETAIKKELDESKAQYERRTKEQQGVIRALRDRIREGQILREKDKFEYSVQSRMNQAYQFNLRSILLIADDELKRLQTKVEELQEKQMRLKQILKL